MTHVLSLFFLTWHHSEYSAFLFIIQKFPSSILGPKGVYPERFLVLPFKFFREESGIVR
jgi:hypothetical protein